ncbi:hypothetical protein SASPL_124833 [Salvia splendens]|uniref:Senescence regulator S40 n=1 Tax=Salvia splendens TaxID=180675 RepID=A0A8X8XEU9_SALSN|nr:uncharacterized protein LOC121746997 [Salvia splendens]KAG6412163.1 hypothetical protein SASPL_124833 [Salvia splendens]
MDPNFAAGFRHRRSPSSDRFLSVFSPPSPADESFASSAGDELSELDVFYTADFSDEHRISNSGASDRRQTERFGILAALQEDRRGISDAVVQKPALWSPSPASISRDIPVIPKRRMSTEPKISQSMPARRFQKSAPVNVPMMPRKVAEAFEDEAGEEEVLPPHEMVARVSLRNEKTTFSVLEGVGRTLKGRDLRQVRNAVWRQTGFLD